MPSHCPSSGAWAKVQAQGTRHRQTSNQSPLSRQLGMSAIGPPLDRVPLDPFTGFASNQARLRRERDGRRMLDRFVRLAATRGRALGLLACELVVGAFGVDRVELDTEDVRMSRGLADPELGCEPEGGVLHSGLSATALRARQRLEAEGVAANRE